MLRAIFFCWSKSLYMLRIVCVCVNRRIKYVSCLRWVCACALWVTNSWFYYCWWCLALATKNLFMWKEKKNLQCVRAFYAQSRPFNSVHLFLMCALSFICIKLIKKRNTEFVRRFWPDQIFMMHCYDAIEVTRFQQIFSECNIDRSLIWIVLSNMCVCICI